MRYFASVRRSTVAAVIGLMFLTVAYAQDVSGTWTAAFETQVGEQQYTYEFVVKGSELTGTAKGNLLGESKITEGKVNGKMITFVENGSYMEMPIRIQYTGTVTSATEIQFSRSVGDFATEEFVAKRVK
jgi:hypothetical protein